jgi:hypothetical protein
MQKITILTTNNGTVAAYGREIANWQNIAATYGPTVNLTLASMYMQTIDLEALTAARENDDKGYLQQFNDEAVMVIGERHMPTNELVYHLCRSKVRTAPKTAFDVKINPAKATPFDIALTLLAEQAGAKLILKTTVEVKFFPMDTLGLLRALTVPKEAAEKYIKETGLDVTEELQKSVVNISKAGYDNTLQQGDVTNSIISKVMADVQHIAINKSGFRNSKFSTKLNGIKI